MRNTIFFCFLLLSTAIMAESMPQGYYDQINGKSDATLKGTLKSIIRNHTVVPYGNGSWEVFYYADRDTVTGLCMDMYCDDWKPLNSPGDKAAGCNVEHSFAKSWWGGDVNEAYKDLYHLVPADYSANRSKSNNAPGIPADSTFTNGSFVTGSGINYGLTRVFCPADEYKGDFARAYFYIVTCYKDLVWLTTGDAGKAMTNDSYLEFRPWLQELLLSWHRSDPVSEKEKTRAIEVNKIQGNRNPFIDYPELVEYIWGNKQGEQVNFHNLTQSFGDPYDETSSALPCVPYSQEGVLKVEHNGQILIRHDHQEHTLIGQPHR